MKSPPEAHQRGATNALPMVCHDVESVVLAIEPAEHGKVRQAECNCNCVIYLELHVRVEFGIGGLARAQTWDDNVFNRCLVM